MGIPTWTMYASHFNSRPRMRANHSRASVICIFGYFNSRPRMRANGDRLLKYRSPLIFQLPPSHEGELHPAKLMLFGRRFQLPPSHEGERKNRRPSLLLDVFQLPPSHEGERFSLATCT